MPVPVNALLLRLEQVLALVRAWADVAVSAGALVPIYLGMLIGRWLRRHCPPGLFRALVLAALAIGGLQMIQAALS